MKKKFKPTTTIIQIKIGVTHETARNMDEWQNNRKNKYLKEGHEIVPPKK